MTGFQFPVGSRPFDWLSNNTKHAVLEVALLVVAFAAEKATELVVPALQGSGSGGELAALVLGWGLLQAKRFVADNRRGA